MAQSLYEENQQIEKNVCNLDLKTMICKKETKQLMTEEVAAKREVKRIQSVPLVVGQFLEMIDQVRGIVGSTTGPNYYVRILSTLDREVYVPTIASGSLMAHVHSPHC